jgi:O-antigen ligase
MSDDALFIPTVAFWILVGLTILSPVRWSVIFFLLLVQIDLSGLGNFSTESLGIENAIKVAIIPTLFLYRIRNEIHLEQSARKYFLFWIAFVGYACIAVLWSPFKTSAIKMVAYLYAYSAIFVIYITAWQQRWLTPRNLRFVVWISLSGAIIQTYLLGNSFGSDEFQWRFTTFSGAQSFAPFLLSLIVLILFQKRVSFFDILTALGAATGLLMTGSRSIFLGLLWVLSIYAIYSAVRSAKRVRIGMILGRMVLTGSIMLGVVVAVAIFLPENRLNEMVGAAIEKNATIEDVGTFGWRFTLYQKTLDELIHRGIPSLLVGSGTSSAARLVLDEGIFQEDNVDPNRAIHDEFLRATYEWGLLGLAAFVLFLAVIIKLDLQLVAENASPQAWGFLAIVVPLLISLTVENILADSGSPGGVGYNLVLSSFMAIVLSTSEVVKKQAEASAAISMQSIPMVPKD